jgi:hypothetical protein
MSNKDNSKDNENVNLVKELENREAGVKELFEFYAGVEAVYAASIKALEEGNISLVSNAANHK